MLGGYASQAWGTARAGHSGDINLAHTGILEQGNPRELQRFVQIAARYQARKEKKQTASNWFREDAFVKKLVLESNALGGLSNLLDITKEIRNRQRKFAIKEDWTY
jgi:hypothetical protein